MESKPSSDSDSNLNVAPEHLAPTFDANVGRNLQEVCEQCQVSTSLTVSPYFSPEAEQAFDSSPKRDQIKSAVGEETNDAICIPLR